MKILTREQFLQLPKGIVYTKFEPFIFGDICIKEESLQEDWVYQKLFEVDVNDSGEFVEMLSHAIEKQDNIPLDFEMTMRDGEFVDNQFFAVLEKEEVVKLIHRLEQTLSHYPNINHTK